MLPHERAVEIYLASPKMKFGCPKSVSLSCGVVLKCFRTGGPPYYCRFVTLSRSSEVHSCVCTAQGVLVHSRVFEFSRICTIYGQSPRAKSFLSDLF